MNVPPVTLPFLRAHPPVGARRLKTGGRREGEASYPPVAQPFVYRHSRQKREEGRDVSKFIRVTAAGTINAEGQSVASGL